MLKLAIGAALLVTAAHSGAVSLGVAQGSVIVGRPLDLLVSSNVTSADAAAGLCLQAEVRYGDRLIAPAAISAVVHELGNNGAATVRVQVSEPVNEPIVTLLLRAGCAAPFQRSYTLLADVETLPALTAVSPAPPVAAPMAPVGPAAGVTQLLTQESAALPPLRVAANGRVGQVVQAPPAEPLEQTPIRDLQPALRPAAVAHMRSKMRPVPVLRLDHESPQAMVQQAAGVAQAVAPPVAEPRLLVEPVPAPVATAAHAELAQGEQAGQTGQEQPPTAAAAVVVGTEPTAETALHTVQLQTLQLEIESLQREQERMRQALEAAQAKMQQPGAAASQQLLVYALAALSLLLLLGLGLLMRARAKARVAGPVSERALPPWWGESAPTAAGFSTPAEPNLLAGFATPPGIALPAQAVDADAAVRELPVKSVQTPAWSDDLAQGLEVADGRESMFREVPVSALDMKGLQYLWQRVGFCVSIEHHQDAMGVLKEFVMEAPRCSEGPYLWWLHLAQDFGTPKDQAEAGRFYESHFQRAVPNLPLKQSSAALLDDQALLQSLQSDWPTDAARPRLQAALGSQPGEAQATLHVRTLAAYDDLIMLADLLDTLDAMADDTAAPARTDAPEVTADDDANVALFASWAKAPNAPQPPMPMLEFELLPEQESVAPPPRTQEPEQARSAPTPLDFDFSSFDLLPKEDAPGPDDATEKPDTKA